MSKTVETEDVRVKGASISFGLIKKVEDTTKLGAEDIFNKLVFLKDSIDESYFEMGGLLHKIRNDHFYLDYGYKDFTSFVEEGIQYNMRKVQYLMRVYQYFGIQLRDEEIIRKIAPLGWSKAKELVGVIDPSNADEWVRIAANNTISELKTLIAKHEAAKKGIPEEDVIPTPKTMVFNLYAEQHANVQDALRIASEISGSTKPSELLSLVSMEYVANNSGVDLADPTKKAGVVKSMLKNLEISMNVKLVALDNKNDIIYGKEYVE